MSNRTKLPPIPLNPPRYLELPEAAAREWQRIARLMRRDGLGTALDVGVLTAYCCACARMIEAERMLRETGLLYTDRDGDQRRHPLIMMARAAAQDMVRLARQLGLTPAARQHVSYDAQDEGDPWESLL